MDKLYKVSEAAEIMGVSKTYLYQLISQEKIPHFKISEGIVRLSIEDIKKFLNSKHKNTHPVYKKNSKKF